MAGVNEVRIIGNVTRDLELRHVGQKNTAVTEVGVAVTERVKKADGWADETNFVDVTVWGRLAEVAAEYLSKGSSVYFAGKLKLESWEHNGKQFSKLKVVAETMQMLGGRPKSEESQERPARREEHSQRREPDEHPF